MNKPLSMVLATLCVVAGIARGQEGEGFSTVFGVPPYTLDSTVIGVEGWKAAIKTENPRHSKVCALPWLPSRTGLLLVGYGLDRICSNLTGRVNLSVDFGLGRLSPQPGKGEMLLVPFVGGRPDSITFGFDNAEGGGFFYEVMDRASTKEAYKGMVRTVFCPRARLTEESFYTLVLDVDLDMKVFNLIFTGAVAEGKKGEIRLKDIDFSNFWSQKFISGIRMINQVPNSVDAPASKSTDLSLTSLAIKPSK